MSKKGRVSAVALAAADYYCGRGRYDMSRGLVLFPWLACDRNENTPSIS
jgi:hypothetical protein